MPERTPGHLFLVRGRIESVVHDAAIVPTDDSFGIEPRWLPVLEVDDPSGLRPPDWPRRGQARAAGSERIWFVSVGTGNGLPTEDLVERTIEAVHEASKADLPPTSNRVNAVLAVPVLGLEGGGHDRDRGDVVAALLHAMYDAVAELSLDIVVVTPEASVYAAAQHVRAELAPDTLDREHRQHAERLGRLAQTGDLALFLGAGVGISAGLPAWRDMLAELGERTGQAATLDFSRLTPLDQAQLLEKRVPDLGKHVVAICEEHTRPSLAHALLAGLRCREAATTNYDHLYETAVAAATGTAPSIVPWQSPVGASSWVLKLHGDVVDPDSIVLTRRDFVRFEARTRPAGALVQALLTIRHPLFLGASMTDDNVVRLIQEVQVYREDHGITEPVGTLLDVDDDAARGELWEGQLSWLAMPGDRLEERVRSLEIFLDTLAWYAADDISWLLDPRFGGLLDREGQDLAEESRRLRRRLAERGSEWHRLGHVLDELGASGGGPD